jgi:hypothetical protein
MAESSRQTESFRAGLCIYFAFLAGSAVYLTFKPENFPDPNVPVLGEGAGFLFWLKVMLWQPPLELAWILFVAALSAWFREGFWPLRLSTAVLWMALPFLLILLWVQKIPIPKPVFAAGNLICWALFYPCLRKLQYGDLRLIASLLLALNVIGLVLIIGMGTCVALNYPPLFNAVQIAGGLWMLRTGTLGLRTLTGLRLPRAFMALLLSLFFQVALAFNLHLLGLVPKEMLKALLYA